MTTTATEQLAEVSHTDRKPRLEYEHRFSFRFGNPHYIYSLVGAEGAGHFNVTDSAEEFPQRHGNRYPGGGRVPCWRYPICTADRAAARHHTEATERGGDRRQTAPTPPRRP